MSIEFMTISFTLARYRLVAIPDSRFQISNAGLKLSESGIWNLESGILL